MFEVIPYSQYENAQTKITYSVEGSGNYTMDADGTFRVQMYNLSKIKHTATIKANISVIKSGISFDENVSKEIEVWLRPAKVGDLVYYDGTYADAAKDNDEKTAIGVCCYVAPRKVDGSINEKFHNPLDKHVRLMCALDDVKTTSSGGIFDSWQWGIYTNTSGVESLNTTNEDGTKKELFFQNNVSVGTIPRLYELPYNGIIKISDETIRDNSGLGLENDGFMPFAANTALGDGFAYNEPLDRQNERKMDDTLLLLAGEDYVKGDMVNSGYTKTLRVIAHRNNIINHCYSGNTINDVIFPLYPILASEDKSELDILAQRITDIRNWAKSDYGFGDTQYGNKWSQMYYPVISACYAYEPQTTKNTEVLLDKFSKHNWFVPTSGLAVRLYWYINLNDSLFAEAIQKNKLKKGYSIQWCISHYSRGGCYRISYSYGELTGTNKSYNCGARPICAF